MFLCSPSNENENGQIVAAYFSTKADGPFACVDCREEVFLRAGRSQVDHFAHANPITCKFALGESELHRRCKMEIFEGLRQHPNTTNVALERSIGEMRPDIFAIINETPVAIEVQISSLSLETIIQRTIRYAQNGNYVLWLLRWTRALDAPRYAPKVWERWIHAAYLGRAYYWTEGLTVVPC